MSALDRRCDELLDGMTAYLEAHIPADERTRIETHVVYCAACYGFLAQLRATVGALTELPVEPIDDAERAELVAAFHAAPAGAGSP